MAKKSSGRNHKLSAGIFGFFFVILLAAAAVFLLYTQAGRFLKTTSLFRIREIVMAPSLRYIDPRLLLFLKGRSIFSVDLDVVHRRLRERYPEVNALRIVRKFPDRIYITAKKREPVAAVTVGREQVLVDREGVVVAPGPAAGMTLPLIEGLRSKRVVYGESLNSAETDVALEVINAFENNTDLRGWSIQTIDARNLMKIDFFLNNNLHVIIDQDNIEPKIMRLGIVLTEGKVDLPNISYIDLRFQEPILGRKDLPEKEIY
jgi:cell division septal protein FtsQ